MSVQLFFEEDEKGYRYGIHEELAILDEEQLNNNPEFKKQIEAFAKELCKQHGLKGITLHGISFSTIRGQTESEQNHG